MKLKILALPVLAALTGNMAGAQDFFSWGFGAPQPQQESRVKFIYDANFDYHSTTANSPPAETAIPIQ